MAKTKKTKITVGDRAAYQLLRLIQEGNENAIMFALTNKIVCKMDIQDIYKKDLESRTGQQK